MKQSHMGSKKMAYKYNEKTGEFENIQVSKRQCVTTPSTTPKQRPTKARGGSSFFEDILAIVFSIIPYVIIMALCSLCS